MPIEPLKLSRDGAELAGAAERHRRLLALEDAARLVRLNRAERDRAERRRLADLEVADEVEKYRRLAALADEHRRRRAPKPGAPPGGTPPGRPPRPGRPAPAPKDPVEARREKRVARGLAWRKNKTRERRVNALKAKAKGGDDERKNRERDADDARKKREAGAKEAESEREARRRATQAAAGSVAATGIRGGGIGQAAGGAIGSALGSRAGPAGAAVGGAIGEKAGAFADNPLAPVGGFATKVAAGDGLGAVTDAADKAAMGLAMIPGVGLPAAAALKTFTSVVNTAREVLGAFAARGRELSGFSGPIAGAAARQDVTRTLTDIREAQLLGSSYAKAIDAQTRFEETLKAGLIPLKEYVLEHLPKIMDTMLDVLIGILRGIDKMVPGTTLLGKIADSAEAMKKALAGPGAGVLPMIDAWTAAAAGMALIEADLGPAGLPAAGVPALPAIFGGP